MSRYKITLGISGVYKVRTVSVTVKARDREDGETQANDWARFLEDNSGWGEKIVTKLVEYVGE